MMHTNPSDASRESRIRPTAELDGLALDWFTALASGYDEAWLLRQLTNPNPKTRAIPEYSKSWNEIGPLIFELGIHLRAPAKGIELNDGKPNIDPNKWFARLVTDETSFIQSGDTPFVAASRCVVMSRFGSEVLLPEALMSALNTPTPGRSPAPW